MPSVNGSITKDRQKAEEEIIAMYPAISWMCIAGMIFAVIMIALWICIGITGGPLARFQPPKPPEILPPPEKKEFGI